MASYLQRMTGGSSTALRVRKTGLHVWISNRALSLLIVWCAALLTGCNPESPTTSDSTTLDSRVSTLGDLEVTARLAEIPEGAIFKRDLYDYATVLKYEVLKVHRGNLQPGTILVAHYNPFKPRDAAADTRVSGIGGNLREFRSGDYHRMALIAPAEDHFMGGIVNKYFGQDQGPIYWALWTDRASKP